MKNHLTIFIIISATWFAACEQKNTASSPGNEIATPSTVNKPDTVVAKKANDAAAILAKKQVPVLCYHHIRNFKPGESERMKNYSVTPEAFKQQMKILADSGYQTILPGQLYNYLVYNEPLPEKPVMITFDDTDEEQYSIGAKEMQPYNFKGVYFIMTISMNRPRYMKKEEIKELAADGHEIACHTWDHNMVTKYAGEDWKKQLVDPKIKLEEITGKEVKHFAYPFGLWNQAAIPEIKKAGYDMAFILSTKRDSTEPLYTIRRMIVPGTWTAEGMLKAMEKTFK